MGELLQLSDETKIYVTSSISVTLKGKLYSIERFRKSAKPSGYAR
jgi:hypothetical protein